MKVFVIESGDFPSDRYVEGVAASIGAAAAAVKEPYGPPYIVRWDDPIEGSDGQWSMTGHFTAVRGHCGDGPQRWDFTPFELHVDEQLSGGKEK